VFSTVVELPKYSRIFAMRMMFNGMDDVSSMITKHEVKTNKNEGEKAICDIMEEYTLN
jgi:hypothetical protein